MKTKKFIIVMAAALLICCVFTACGNETAPAPQPEYTVAFNSDGGSPVDAQTVKKGGRAVKPDDPVKQNCVFKGWLYGGGDYDFTLPVTENITLTAKWENITHTVTFKTGSGENQVKVQTGGTVDIPPIPKQSNGFFKGWFTGETPFDFTSPVTEDITVTAKFITLAEATAEFNAAAAADYSNYTAVRVVNEYDPEEEVMLDDSYTETFKRSGSEVYYTNSGSGDRYVKILPDFTAIYYVNRQGEWATNEVTGAPDYVMPLKFAEITEDDLDLIDGKYFVKTNSMLTAGISLFGVSSGLYPQTLTVENGIITEISGYGSYVAFTMRLSGIGSTAVAAPQGLPPVNAVITAQNKEVLTGDTITEADIIKMFSVKADGKTVTVTADMLDLDGLNLASPQNGDYTITLTYISWDGVNHTQTAALAIKENIQSTMTFEQIMARDYSNLTVTASSGTKYYRNGDLFYLIQGVNERYIRLDSAAENGYTAAKYNTNAQTSEKLDYTPFPRVELLFALNPSLFTRNEDGSYTISNDPSILTVLKYNEALANTQVITEDGTQTYDYSITLTLNNNCVYQITFSYYTKSFNRITQKTSTYTVTDVGSTAPIKEMPTAVRDILYPES